MDSEFTKQGSFSEIVLPSLIVKAMRAHFMGMFRAEKEAIIKVIYFKEGDIAFASSNQPSDRLGEVLIKRGQLTREQLDMAMSRLEANVSLGKMLVELGFLTPKELLEGAKTQVEEILYSLNTWQEGKFEFIEGPLPQRIVNLNLNTRQVIMQGIMQLEDRRWILDNIGSMETVFSPTPDFQEITEKLQLDSDVSYLLANIDGRKNIRDLCQLGKLDDFTVGKALCGLYLLGALDKAEISGLPGGAEEFPQRAEEQAPSSLDDTLVGALEEEDKTEDESPLAAAFEEEEPPPTAQEDELIGAPDSDQTATSTAKIKADQTILEQETERDESILEGPDESMEDEEDEDIGGALFDDEEEALGGELPSPIEEEEPFDVPEEAPSSRKWLMPLLAVILGTAVVIVAASYFYPWLKERKETAQLTPTPEPTATISVIPTLKPTTKPTVRPGGTIAPTPTKSPVRLTPTPTAVRRTPTSTSTPRVQPTPRSTYRPTATPPPGGSTSTKAPVSAAAILPADGYNKLHSTKQYGEAATSFKNALRGKASNSYTIQLELVCQDKSVETGLREALKSKDYFIISTSYQGRRCYVACWGLFGSKKQAQRAYSELPGFFTRQQNSKPRIVPVRKFMR
ncbi:DUF4388 domain-containing protein [Acidobacteriota bacterium]